MPGLGKTTLAGMIFHHEEIQYEFPTRIWVHISSQFTKKDVFLAILKELKNNLAEDIYCKSDHELASLVAAELDERKFLIVMDDVWTSDDWDKLKTALPDNNNRGKVLITSRQVDVARYANCDRDPHRLRFLTDDESCLLLCLEALHKREFPRELASLGRKIATECCGLPLAIVVIGGILARKNSASDPISSKEDAWERVSQSVSTYLIDDPGKRMEKIISLSYNKLPYHLRACFLYLGMFPEDYEISVWKLIRMWIAEGFIQQKDNISLEETAYNYLDDLINRNLLRIDKMSRNGRVKTCRIHDMLRDFCKTEGGSERENFLQEMKDSKDGGFVPSVSGIQKCRRLCVHSNILEFIFSNPYGPRVRSFVCFPKDEIPLQNENISAIPAAFKLLRVLDVKPIKFNKLSSDLFELVHLRYIHLFLNSKKLAPAFSKLWNIQTLRIDTNFRTLEIQADIWQLINLRHLKTTASATLPKPKEKSSGGEKLQTLSTIAPQSCTEEIFNRARNLKKLGIRGRMDLFLDVMISPFERLRKLGSLEKLKLINDVDINASSDVKQCLLPQHYKFPLKLRSLTLSGTSLEWELMSTLGLLENLKVLKLKNKAFTGEIWEASDGGFRRLEVLHIGRKSWIASSHHFPRLRQLELHNCDELKEIPFGLADIPTLQLLDLYLAKLAVVSAKKIREAKEKKQEEQNSTQVMSVFKLTIFPLDE